MDIRKAFLDYFADKGHTLTPSSPLVPDDATLLFTNAGMVQFKGIFTGDVAVPNPPRAVSSQTCIRAGGKHNDLENVGFTARHHTFFEMLGNFSFGDYFKEDAIRYAWEFVTDVLQLPKERLWITIHDSDDEAGEIWKKYVSADKIVKMGDKDNFWQMGDTGPCGPCSEIHFDQGAEKFDGPEDYLGGEGDRFLEIWNLVFMQYERKADGTLTPLPKPSIDTGMGLERVTAIKEGKFSNYDTPLFMPIIDHVSKLCGKQYSYDTGASWRVIADHVRAVSFLLAQEVNFDKEGRGYVLRRILRRAVRHGYLLGLTKPFLYQLVDTLCDIMGGGYPYLVEKKSRIAEQIRMEEERFFATIAAGMELFEKELSITESHFSGEVAFKLYDTYGFPLDLTQDMLKDKDLGVDLSMFEKCMHDQKTRARAAWKGSGDEASEGDFKELLEQYGKNSFVGYTTLSLGSKVVALLDEKFKQIEALPSGAKGWVMLEPTPFYAQSGGQLGDTGELVDSARVLDTRKFQELNLSKVETTKEIKKGELVYASVDENRHETARHHSATHLLHAVLREKLGDGVTQAGSEVGALRLRFDFTFARALSNEEISQIEESVNRLIAANIAGNIEELPIAEAKKRGAMALFGEKYGDTVRVVSFGDASLELCGGCHTSSTGEIGGFFITKESGVSAGVRRIEGVCGMAAFEYAKNMRSQLAELCDELKNKDPHAGVKRLKQELKEAKEAAKKAQSGASKELFTQTVNGISIVVDMIEGDAKMAVDDIKNRHEKVAVLLFTMDDGKVTVTAGAKNCSLHAGNWVKEVCSVLEGKGGGRPDFASGGGKDTARIEEAKLSAIEFAKTTLQG